MKSSSLLARTAAAVALGLLSPGCGHSNGDSGAATSAPDASDASTSHPEDAGGAADDAADSSDGPADMTPDAADSSAVVDAGICMPGPNASACDKCTAANCCAYLQKCADEATDAGMTACLQIASCVDDCLYADSGPVATLTGCSSTCSRPFGASPAVTDYEELLGCQVPNCAMQCP